MKSKAILTAFILLTAILLISAGCSDSSSAPTQNSTAETRTETAPAAADSAADSVETKEPYKLRAVTQQTFSETIIADMLGFFADEDIEMEYIGALGTGVTQFQAIELGEIDVFTQGHLTEVAKARLGGLMMTAVAPGFIDDPDNPHVNYLVREDSPLQTLADITKYNAKIAADPEGVCTGGFIIRFCNDNGLDWHEVEFVNIQGQVGLAEQSLLQGLIDVTTSHTPLYSKALAQGGVRSLGTSYDIVQSPSGGLAVRGFSDKFIEEHPDVVQGWVNAMYRARVFMENNPVYSSIVGAEYLELTPEEAISNSYDQHKNIEPEWAEQWVKLGEASNYWETGQFKAEELYTNQFVPEDAPASDAEIGKEYLGQVN
jgi:ABC-type nitrate/sulfonate/bicarbonate transport system substrate-binding protein